MISITDPQAFSATTDNDSLEFDTKLFLFSAGGKGLFANDDSDSSFGSTIPAGSLDGGAGLYYLAISSFGRTPTGLGGSIFPDCSRYGFLHGPDGPGGGSSVNGWRSAGVESGGYRIDLTGASFGLVNVRIDVLPTGAADGLYSVVLNGSDELDVSKVTISSLRFGPGQAVPTDVEGGSLPSSYYAYVDSDYHLDLVTHYRQSSTGISGASSEEVLTGRTAHGLSFHGVDDVLATDGALAEIEDV